MTSSDLASPTSSTSRSNPGQSGDDVPESNFTLHCDSTMAVNPILLTSFDDTTNVSVSQPTLSSHPLLENDVRVVQSFVGQQNNDSTSPVNADTIQKEREELMLSEDAKIDGRTDENKFAFSPAVMDKLLDGKNLSVLAAVGGPHGLELGLRTNLLRGLNVEENILSGHVSFKDVEKMLAGGSVHTDTVPAEVQITPTWSLLPSKRTTGHFTDRKKVFKDNQLPPPQTRSFLQFLWGAYNDKVLMLLTVAAVISLGIGLYQSLDTPRTANNPPVEWVQGVTIIIAIVVIVLVGSINDYQKERQFLRLSEKQQSRYVQVIRSGKSQQISIFDILVGDLVHLELGDVVPADGIFIDGHNVRCDESSQTGESDHIHKYPAERVFQAIQNGEDTHKLDPFILSGSRVVEGVGIFLVTATGINSSYGKILASLKVDPDVTPLQSRLEKLASQIAKLGALAALIMFIGMFIKFLIELKHNTNTPAQKGQQFLNVLIIALTILVIAVPEGLPLAVTLALAFASNKMIRDRNLVRRLNSCETMGNATTICSDKTGTITQNKMKVIVGTIGTHLRFQGKGDNVNTTTSAIESLSLEKEIIPQNILVISLSEIAQSISKDMKDLLEKSIAINSTAFESEEHGIHKFIGSKTESALLLFARDHLGMESVAIERSNAKIVQLAPFNAIRKCMAVVVELANNTYRMYVKGAPELLLNKCTKIIEDSTDGISESNITTKDMTTLKETITSYSSRSLRTIGLFYRDFECWPPSYAHPVNDDASEVIIDDIIEDLVFLAVFGIQDPLREDVKEAVKTCQKAGVVVRMVTGDNLYTAKIIAMDCGILSPNGLVMEGSKFRALDESELLQTIPRLQVLARSSPEDKRVLVQHLKAMGEIVAVTGDGTNDAGALAAADVGFAMGISGTEIARESASIILMDDNFSSIVKAIMWGRTVNDAVKKFLQFQITITITSIVLAFVSALANHQEQSVLTPVQLMWVNLIQDTLAALALATDAPTPSVLNRKPESRSSPLITRVMWKTIAGQSLYQLAVTLILYFGGTKIFHYETAHQRAQLQTAIFNTYVWLNIFNQWNCRRIDDELNIFEGMHHNWLFLSINSIMIGGQIIFMFIGGQAFSITRITGVQWAYSLVLGILSLAVGVLIRLIPFWTRSKDS